MKKYIAIENTNDVNALRVELYYSLGGTNYFTGAAESRGYYLSVTPVYRSHGNGYTMESYTAFTGIKQLVKPVTRKSAKAEQAAVALAADIEKQLVNYVIAKNNIAAENVKRGE